MIDFSLIRSTPFYELTALLIFTVQFLSREASLDIKTLNRIRCKSEIFEATEGFKVRFRKSR